MATYESRFAVRDQVVVDGDQRLMVHVTAVLWRNEKPSYEISWFADGQSRTAWIEDWRLEPYDA